MYQYPPWQPFGYNPGAYQPAMQQPALQYAVTKVHGREGMEKLPMAPNSQGLFLDETQAVIWFAQTDGGGYKTLTPYSITPFTEAKPVDTASLEARVAKLEELINGGKPDTGADGTGTGPAA